MILKDTVPLMCSEDYRSRFLAEYLQLKIRTDKLEAMIKKWRKNELAFTPNSPIDLLETQLNCMKSYLACLDTRASREGLKMPTEGMM